MTATPISIMSDPLPTISELQERLIKEGKLTDPASPRGRLLQHAAQLFRTKGYERTTVRDLAAATGIQSGSIFHHFASKNEILHAVMVEAITLNLARMHEALAVAGPDPAQRLLALIRCELHAINGATGEAMAVLFHEWNSLNEEARTSILTLRTEYEGLWLEVLERLYKAGRLRTQPALVRRLLTGALAWTIHWFRPTGPMSLDELAGEVLRLLLDEPAVS
jgi:AcrR family transcriptional regulator